MSQLFIIIGRDKPGSGELRAATRPAHLDHARKIGAGLKLAGPMLGGGPEPQPCGSVLVIEAENLAAAQAFADADPYALAGLFESVTVAPWNAVLGHWVPAP